MKEISILFTRHERGMGVEGRKILNFLSRTRILHHRISRSDDYAAEARDEHVTKLDNVLYIIIALVNIKTSKHLSETNEDWNKTRG